MVVARPRLGFVHAEVVVAVLEVDPALFAAHLHSWEPGPLASTQRGPHSAKISRWWGSPPRSVWATLIALSRVLQIGKGWSIFNHPQGARCRSSTDLNPSRRWWRGSRLGL